MMVLVILKYLVVLNLYNPDATIDNGSCDYDHSACIFPPEYFGNTGGNMTLFLTSGVISSLPLTSPNPLHCFFNKFRASCPEAHLCSE